MMNVGYGSGSRGTMRKVLVVEDNDFNRQVLKNVLQDNGFQIVEARDGLEGLEQLSKHYEDLALVLLDVYMPRCDGFEFLHSKGADKRYDTVPVIVATAGGANREEVRCLKLGANDFVLKPYDFEVIINRINNMIRLRESAAIVNQLRWDDTTGLYTKEFFYRAVSEELATHPAGTFDLVCSDVENFKSLNDRYGESNCDALLRELGAWLTDTLPGLVARGRIGGDVFAFLIEHQQRGWEQALGAASEKMPFANVNVKFGIVEKIGRDITVSQACTWAISALETVKGLYGAEVAWFDDELHQKQVMEQIIRESMGDALERREFTVYYQPKHDMHTNKVGGAEALVRWVHPELGFVRPDLFIPVFERNGFITTLDLFVWEEACREIARCRELGLPEIPISINASRLDFDAPNLPTLIAELADRHGVKHELLHVELTETAYSDNPESVKRMLQELKDLGFSTELDDFGSGYSSLVSLNTLPLDVMKLDMSMIRQATALNDYRIVESTINLARVLGLKTVVEGVETADEARRVTEMGCDLIQGYYFSKPLSREEFEAYLAQ